MSTSKNTKISVRKIITAGIVGLAGGVTTFTSFIPGVTAVIIGSVVGAGVSGIAEYQREIKANALEANNGI
jgi:hypothetical protein